MSRYTMEHRYRAIPTDIELNKDVLTAVFILLTHSQEKKICLMFHKQLATFVARLYTVIGLFGLSNTMVHICYVKKLSQDC